MNSDCNAGVTVHQNRNRSPSSRQLTVLHRGAALGYDVVPHAVRLLIGSDHRRLLITSALTGAIFLVSGLRVATASRVVL